MDERQKRWFHKEKECETIWNDFLREKQWKYFKEILKSIFRYTVKILIILNLFFTATLLFKQFV